MFELGSAEKQITNVSKEALRNLVYNNRREGMMVCEVGSWTGETTATIAKEIEPVSGIVHCVDWFKGSEGTALKGAADTYDVLNVHRDNMKALGVANVRYHVMSSRDAAWCMADKLFDIVFIDADHRYTNVFADIILWTGKVRQGGIICGHDLEMFYEDLPTMTRESIQEWKDVDFVKYAEVVDPEAATPEVVFKWFHPGVTLAIHELFAKPRVVKDDTIWAVRV